MIRILMDGASRLETHDTSCQDIIYKIMKMSIWHSMVQQNSLVSSPKRNLESQGRSVMEPKEAGNEETGYLAVTLMTQTTIRSLLREMEVLVLLAVMTLNQPMTLTRSLMILQVVVTSLLLLIPRKQTRLHLLTLNLIQALTSRQIPVVVEAAPTQPMTPLINQMIPLRNLTTHQVAEVVISQQAAIQLTQSLTPRQIPKRLIPILQLVEAALTQPMTPLINQMTQLAAVVTSQQEAIQLTLRLTQKLILLPILRQTLRRPIRILLLVVVAPTQLMTQLMTLTRNLMILPVKLMIQPVKLMIQLAKPKTLLEVTRMKRQPEVTRMKRQLEVMKMRRQLEMTRKKRKQATHTIHSRSSTTRISQLAITTNSLNTTTLSRHLTLRIT